MARRVSGTAGTLLQKFFDDTVFKRVESHNRQPTAGIEQAFGSQQPLLQFTEFIIDCDPERLKSSRRGVNPVATSR